MCLPILFISTLLGLLDIPVKTRPVAGMARTWPVLDNFHEQRVRIAIKEDFPDLLQMT